MATEKASDVESLRRDRTKTSATRKRDAAVRDKAKKPGFFADRKPGHTSLLSLCLSPQSCFSLVSLTSDSVS